jgi:hypothetical protein
MKDHAAVRIDSFRQCAARTANHAHLVLKENLGRYKVATPLLGFTMLRSAIQNFRLLTALSAILILLAAATPSLAQKDGPQFTVCIADDNSLCPPPPPR